MHQNSPKAIADYKKFPGEKPPDSRFWGDRYAAGGEGKGQDVGRGEGREGEESEGGPFVKS